MLTWDRGSSRVWAEVLRGGLWTLAAMLIVACGGGGGSSDPPADPVRLSTQSADAGQFIEVAHETIEAGQILPVRFDWGAYRVELSVTAAQAGRVWVQVPPYLDPLGALASGNLSVSVPGSAPTGLSVAAPPDFAADVAPGDVLRWLLVDARSRQLAARDSLLADQLASGVDTQILRASIDGLVADLDAWIEEINTRSTLTLSRTQGDPLVITAEGLRLADRVLFALIFGATDHAAAQTPVTTSRYLPAEIPRLPQQQFVFDTLQGWADQLQGCFERVEAGSGALTAGAGLLAGLSAAALGMSAAPALLVGALAAGGTALVLGPLAESVDGLGHRIEVMIESDRADAYEFGQRFLQSAGNAAESFYFTLVGGADEIGGVIGNAYNAYEVYRNSRDLACNSAPEAQKPRTYSVDGFCADTAVPPPLSVLLAPASTQLQAGATGQWTLAAMGGAPPYSFACDWGYGATEILADPRAVNQISHVYAETGSYQLSVLAGDAAEQRVSVAVTVEVLADEAPACQVYEPSDRWLMEYDFDCNGTIDSDSLWHFLADGRISDHWLGVIEGYTWRRDGQLITIDVDSTSLWYEGQLSEDCLRINDGRVIFVDPRPDPSCWQARKY